MRLTGVSFVIAVNGQNPSGLTGEVVNRRCSARLP